MTGRDVGGKHARVQSKKTMREETAILLEQKVHKGVRVREKE